MVHSLNDSLIMFPTELDLINQLRKRFTSPTPGVRLGIGDDAAILEPTQGYELLVTTDALMEGVHFLPGANPFALGRKAAAVNLSDMAAMGGIPKSLLITVAVPTPMDSTWMGKFYDGLESMCREHSIFVVGGDTSRSLNGVAISITLIGEVESGKALLRNGAKENDLIFTTGTLGDSGAGLELLLAGTNEEGDQEKLIQRHLEPVPRVSSGRFLLEKRFTNSCMDLSDGFSSDIHRLCDESGMGAVIHEKKLPLSEELLRFEAEFKHPASHYALNGGEDYELLFTVPPENKGQLLSDWPEDFPILTQIGEITAKEKGVSLIKENGEKSILAPGGFDHFSH